MFELVTEKNIDIAAGIHSISWKESHKSFCSEEFVQAHTIERQAQYIREGIESGKKFYILICNGAKGIVSVNGNLIENLYVLPGEQRKGYGAKLLNYAEIMCNGTPTLWILSSNDSARKFYQKQGYQFTGKEKSLNATLKELEMQHEINDWFTVEEIDESTYAISEYIGNTKSKSDTHTRTFTGTLLFL